jgi:hypothetical protein
MVYREEIGIIQNWNCYLIVYINLRFFLSFVYLIRLQGARGGRRPAG